MREESTSKLEMSTYRKPVTLTNKKPKRSMLVAAEEDKRLNDELFQAALDVMVKLAEYVKLETKDFTFHPQDNCFEKLFAQFFKKSKHIPIYSSSKSINIVGGRMIYAAIAKKVGLEAQFNMTGCNLWRHGWDDGVRCFHSAKMILKENIIEMNPTSEAGINALKEGKGILSTNKMGKQVVKIVNDNSVVCAEDVDQIRFGSFSPTSCGMLFTDSSKAKIAQLNAIEYTAAVFPKTNMKHVLFIVTSCECNYAGKVVLGKQLARITPFAMSGLDNICASDLDSVKSVAVKYPAVFVFQCCNYQGTKKFGASRSCEFKISYPDLIQCLISARTFWGEVFGESMPIQFPTFKWEAAFAVKNALIPCTEVCKDENPFGDIPEPKRMRVIEVAAESDEEDIEEDDE